jgi:TetR/AcrR family transcriptional repressor of nem operon
MPRPPTDSRIRIVHAALRLFADRGYDGTSIKDVLRESSCTRGALYYYFSSKEELGYAVIDEELRLLTEQVVAPYMQDDEPLTDRLLRILDALPITIKLESGHHLLTGLVLRMAYGHEGFRRRLLARERAQARQFEETVRKAIADGELAESVDPSQLTHFAIIVSHGLQTARLLGQEQVMPEKARNWIREYLNWLGT